LRCSYCDTTYAYEEGAQMEIEELLERVAGYRCPLVEITGGEPLFQHDTPVLIKRLLEEGYEVMMETNGSFNINTIDRRCIKIVDIKCPGSGESDKNDLDNLKRLESKDQVKFVIGSREDYEYANTIIKLIDPDFPIDRILFSPVTGKMVPGDLAAWILEDNLNVRLHLQLHKILWPEMTRGV